MTNEEHRLAGAEPAENQGDIADTLDDDMTDTNHNINESHDKIRLEADLTRGTDTRDQEKHKLKARGETPEEAAENLSKALAELEERDVFNRARKVGNDD